MLSNYASLLLIKLKNLTTNNGMCSRFMFIAAS